jgi:hypothetical protein
MSSEKFLMRDDIFSRLGITAHNAAEQAAYAAPPHGRRKLLGFALDMRSSHTVYVRLNSFTVVVHV